MITKSWYVEKPDQFGTSTSSLRPSFPCPPRSVRSGPVNRPRQVTNSPIERSLRAARLRRQPGRQLFHRVRLIPRNHGLLCPFGKPAVKRVRVPQIDSQETLFCQRDRSSIVGDPTHDHRSMEGVRNSEIEMRS
jgi:hypothetical protein